MVFRRQPLKVFIPALVLFLLASIIPVIYALIQLIFKLVRYPSTTTQIILDSRQIVLLGRSLLVASSATLVALILGLPTAIILAAKDLPFRRYWYLLVLVPLLIPPYVMAGAWIHLLTPDGLFNRVIMTIFSTSAKLSIFSLRGCVWCLGISHFPIIAIILAAGLSKIDRSLQDIARLHAGPLRVFRYSTLPQILPHLVASICLVMVFILGRYGVPSLLGINTYPVEIFAQYSAFYDNIAATATALPLIVLVIMLILLQKHLMFNRNYI